MPNEKPKPKNDDELPEEVFRVARLGQTERPFTGKYVNEKAMGIYLCAVCGHELFSSETKFDSNTGWPSFTEPADPAKIKLETDNSSGMKRTAVSCQNCGAHLGHVFDDGPQDRGGKRYCINSVCLELKESGKGPTDDT